MATIKYLLRNKSNNSNIYVRFSNGRDSDFMRKTGLVIDSSDWSKKGMPKQNNASNKNLTVDLNNLRTFILSRLNADNSKGVVISADWLLHIIDVYFQRVSENKTETGVVYWLNHIIDNSKKIKNSKGGKGLSYNRLKAYKGLLINFTEYQKPRSLKIQDLGKKEFNKFYDWLIDVKAYADSTATKKATDLQAVVRYAESKDVKIATDFKSVKFDKVATYDDDMDIVTLSLSDIEKIERLDLDSEALINARKWLILACFTAQRGTALTTRLVADNFKNTPKGLQIIFKQIKGNKKVIIPVLPKTKEIYDSGLPYKISTQKLNRHIETICKEAEINELILGKKRDKETNRTVKKLRPKYEYIRTHTGRRTFATLHYGNIPNSLIMKVTGHKKESDLLAYIHQADDDHIDSFNDYYDELQKRKPTMLVVKNASSY